MTFAPDGEKTTALHPQESAPAFTNFAKRSGAAEVPAQRSFAPLGAALKVLMVWPQIPSSFWGFQGMMNLLPEKTTMPPLGLITIAAMCPKSWTIRLIDEAFEELRDSDILWADRNSGSMGPQGRTSFGREKD
jgi:hypothetical protein